MAMQSMQSAKAHISAAELVMSGHIIGTLQYCMSQAGPVVNHVKSAWQLQQAGRDLHMCGELVYKRSTASSPCLSFRLPLQFIEIVLIFWEEDYKLAVLLQVVTLGANSIVIARMYQSRLKLYQSVSMRRLIPIVQAGRVR